MKQVLPPISLKNRINVTGCEKAGALLHGWAKRTEKGLPSTERQIEILRDVIVTADKDLFDSLGGDETKQWLSTIPSPEIKAKQPGTIDILGLPYGGHADGRDSDGQYFSKATDFMDTVIPYPPVMYAHGTALGNSAEVIGEVTDRWYDESGGWFRVKLHDTSDKYEQLIKAYENKTLGASTGVVRAAHKVGQNGHIDVWLPCELSLVDTSTGIVPINRYATVKAASDTLFEDYYGDEVKVRKETLLERLRANFSSFMESIANDLSSNGVKFNYWSTGVYSPADFLYPDRLLLPVTSQEELALAIRDHVNYDLDIAEFKAKLNDHAERIGLEVPDDWRTIKMENCPKCDEARKLADALKAELNAEKCGKCPDAVNLIKAAVTEGFMSPKEAFIQLERFTEDDDAYTELYNDIKAKREAGTIKAKKPDEPLSFVPPPAVKNVDTDVDQEFMNKMRKSVGLEAR